jgi:hypothetical protein
VNSGYEVLAYLKLELAVVRTPLQQQAPSWRSSQFLSTIFSSWKPIIFFTSVG